MSRSGPLDTGQADDADDRVGGGDCVGGGDRVGDLSGLIRLARGEIEEPGISPAIGVTGAEGEGSVIGRYTLLRILGEGGMGSVWLARQSVPIRREVALKIIKLGMDTREVVARFEAERQALAVMDHPHIARVYDGGTTDSGRPYFVMECVDGIPITQYCDDHNLSLRSRLEVFAQVCDALQHAHQKGIVHRDIKPSNVLVSAGDGGPVPKVIDFGVAKAASLELERTRLLTEFDQLVGTIEYMAPEQAEMSSIDIDTRADVYSLGVLAYELLTGTRPFDLDTSHARARADALRTIREIDPPSPSSRVSTLGGSTRIRTGAGRAVDAGSLAGRLRGDLDWIVLRALEKDRDRRYETASAFAADVRRFLADKPVEASPPGRIYRISKFIRRNRTAFAASVIIVLLLIVGAVGATWAWLDARDRNEEIVEALRAREEALRDREAALAKEQAQRQIATAATAEAEAQLERAVAIKQLLADMLRNAEPKAAMGADTTLLVAVLDETADRLVGGEITDERTVIELHHLIGLTFHGVQEFERAEQHLKLALQGALDLVGETDPMTLDAFFALALLRMHQGRDLDVLDMIQHRIPVWESVHGASGPMVGRFEALIAEAERNLGRHEDARSRLEAVLDLNSTTLGTDHRFTMNVAAVLAHVLMQFRDMERARELLQMSFEWYARNEGNDHYVTLRIRKQLALLQNFLGHRDEAIAIAEAAADASSGILGPGYYETLAIQVSFAEILCGDGRNAEADKVFAEVIDHGTRSLGATNPIVLRARLGRGVLLKDLGRLAEAEELLEATLALYPDGLAGASEARETRARTVPLELLLYLVDVYANQSRFDRVDGALPAVLLEVERLRERLGESTEMPERMQHALMRSLTNVAHCCNRAGRFTQARDLLAISLPLLNASFGCAHSWTVNAHHEMAMALDGLGQRDAATEAWRAYHDCALVRMQATPPPTPGELHLVALKFMAPMREEFLDLDIAAEAAERAVAMTESENPRMVATLAEILIRADDLDGAVEALEGVMPNLDGETDGVRQMFASKLAELQAELARRDRDAGRLDG